VRSISDSTRRRCPKGGLRPHHRAGLADSAEPEATARRLCRRPNAPWHRGATFPLIPLVLELSADPIGLSSRDPCSSLRTRGISGLAARLTKRSKRVPERRPRARFYWLTPMKATPRPRRVFTTSRNLAGLSRLSVHHLFSARNPASRWFPTPKFAQLLSRHFCELSGSTGH